MHRAGFTIPSQEPETARQKLSELFLAHFSGRHFKFPVLNRSVAAHVTINSNVIRRVDKHHIRLAAGHYAGERVRLERIATEYSVFVEKPKIPSPRDWRSLREGLRILLHVWFAGSPLNN